MKKKILWLFSNHYLDLKNWFGKHIFMFPTILFFLETTVLNYFYYFNHNFYKFAKVGIK